MSLNYDQRPSLPDEIFAVLPAKIRRYFWYLISASFLWSTRGDGAGRHRDDRHGGRVWTRGGPKRANIVTRALSFFSAFTTPTCFTSGSRRSTCPTRRRQVAEQSRIIPQLPSLVSLVAVLEINSLRILITGARLGKANIGELPPANDPRDGCFAAVLRCQDTIDRSRVHDAIIRKSIDRAFIEILSIVRFRCEYGCAESRARARIGSRALLSWAARALPGRGCGSSFAAI